MRAWIRHLRKHTHSHSQWGASKKRYCGEDQPTKQFSVSQDSLCGSGLFRCTRNDDSSGLCRFSASTRRTARGKGSGGSLCAKFVFLFVASLFFLFMHAAMPFQKGYAAATAENVTKGKSGLPIPRFVSLRSDEVNLRTGPGTRYPIEWVLRRQGLPVEIIAEYDVWFRVRDADGVVGWVSRGMVTGRRMALVHGATRNLLQDGSPAAPTVARIENGATGKILSCKVDWCRLEFGNVKGYLRKSEFWGAYPEELIR